MLLVLGIFISLSRAWALEDLSNPSVGFVAIAQSLGLPTRDKACAYSAGDLTSSTIQEWNREKGLFKPARFAGDEPMWRMPQWLSEEWSCTMLEDNIRRDSRVACLPKVAEVFHFEKEGAKEIFGEISYIGFAPYPYAYEIEPVKNLGVRVSVRLHFTGPLIAQPEKRARLEKKLQEAEKIWHEQSPARSVFFSFRLVESPGDAHFVLPLIEGAPRNAYNWAWGIDWSSHVMAHELGHMMGLDDEYNQLRKTAGHLLGYDSRWVSEPALKTKIFQCDISSLMCDSGGLQSIPQLFHYYLILRRAFCHTMPYETFNFN